LKKIQYKIATVEHLTLLSETICSKYHQLKQSYESTSKKSMKGTPVAMTTSGTSQRNSHNSTKRQSSSGSSVPTANRTCLHFNKLIIDERRKLETLEKKIKDAIKSLGQLEPHEVYEDSEGGQTDDNNQADYQRPMNNGMNESKQPFSPPLRRASVSLRQALATTPTTPEIQQRRPFQSFPEDDEDDEGSGIGEGKSFHRSVTSSKNPFSSSLRSDANLENMSTIGLTKHEIDRKLLFKKSESDRLQLIEENRRLRGEISHVTSRIYDHTPGNPQDHSSDNLTYVINELNGWDIERDELDAQIDRLTAHKEALIQKLTATSRGSKYQNSKEAL
jgi:hypothetical protein